MLNGKVISVYSLQLPVDTSEMRYFRRKKDFHLHKIIQNRGLLYVCVPVCLSSCLSVLLMNKTSTNSLIFYFDKAKQKNVCSVYMKNIPKYFVLLSRNNPLILKGLKYVDLKIIQMYHFRLKWKRYILYAHIGGNPTFFEWDSNFFGVGLPLFPVGLLLFARWES